jgi:N-acetylglutamate synthase
VIAVRSLRAGDGAPLRSLWISVGFRLIGDSDVGLAVFAKRNPGLVFVAEDDGGRIVGSAMGAWDGRRGWLYHVAVAPDQRRTGLGRDLVRRAEEGLRGLGCLRALVIVEASNDDAVGFWQALGYEIRDTHQMGKAL